MLPSHIDLCAAHCATPLSPESRGRKAERKLRHVFEGVHVAARKANVRVPNVGRRITIDGARFPDSAKGRASQRQLEVF